MNEKLNSDLSSHIRWAKFIADVVYWIAIFYLAKGLSALYLTFYTCNINMTEKLYQAATNDQTLLGWLLRECDLDVGSKAWAVAFFLATLIRIIFLTRINWLTSIGASVYPARVDGQEWRLTNAISNSIIEWLPALLGAAYVFIFGVPANIFSVGVHISTIIGAQLIWLAPVLFRFNDRNLAEIISGVKFEVTDKAKEKIKKNYNKKLIRSLAHVSFGANYISYLVLTGIFIFSFVETLRIPEQNPAYQEALYGGYQPIWEDNTYFAMQGLSAPENISDYYQYGLKKAFDHFQTYETLKERSGIDQKYLYQIPDLDHLSVALEENKELNINSKPWKRLNCLYDLHAKQNVECASFEDWQGYTEQNNLIWDRYNRAPDFGDVYVTTPQILGSYIKYLPPLAELKAAHIIYMAKNGNHYKAMEEWLKYTNLYRAMAENRDMMYSKVDFYYAIVKQLSTLEKLLSIAPDLATTYQDDLLFALNNKEPSFRSIYMISDDLGMMEPLPYGAIGNHNTLQNDYFKCIENAEAQTKTPLNKYLYAGESITLCPLQEEKTTLEEFLSIPSLAHGDFLAKFGYILLIKGLLIGNEWDKSIKLTQVRFKQAELAVTILSQNVKANQITNFVSSMPAEHQNPITNQPFEWDEEGQYLYFERPDTKTKYKFRLNLKK